MVILYKINLLLIKMNPREILSKEICDKVGGKISEQTVSEKVSQFVRHGNVFLLFEIMSLRKEIARLKEEIQHQRNRENRKSVHALPVP